MNALEKLLYGGQVMFIGLVIVFAVLILLIVIISLLSAAMRKMDEKNAPAPEPVKSALAPVPVVRQPEPKPVVAAEETAAEDDAQLIAVIAAALAAYDSGNKLVVRSVRRVGGWKNANRSEQVYRF